MQRLFHGQLHTGGWLQQVVDNLGGSPSYLVIVGFCHPEVGASSRIGRAIFCRARTRFLRQVEDCDRGEGLRRCCHQKPEHHLAGQQAVGWCSSGFPGHHIPLFPGASRNGCRIMVVVSVIAAGNQSQAGPGRGFPGGLPEDLHFCQGPCHCSPPVAIQSPDGSGQIARGNQAEVLGHGRGDPVASKPGHELPQGFQFQ